MVLILGCQRQETDRTSGKKTLPMLQPTQAQCSIWFNAYLAHLVIIPYTLGAHLGKGWNGENKINECLRRCAGAHVSTPCPCNCTTTGPGTAASSGTPTWNLPCSYCRRPLCGRRGLGIAAGGDNRSPSGRIFPSTAHIVHLVLFALRRLLGQSLSVGTCTVHQSEWIQFSSWVLRMTALHGGMGAKHAAPPRICHPRPSQPFALKYSSNFWPPQQGDHATHDMMSTRKDRVSPSPSSRSSLARSGRKSRSCPAAAIASASPSGSS